MNSVTEKETLYTEYRDKVRGYVFGKLQNQSDAEDIVSEIFLKIYKRYDSFDKDNHKKYRNRLLPLASNTLGACRQPFR